MPGLVAGLQVDHLALEAAALGPAQVHAQQHLGPVLRLGAAGAGMDRDDGVLAIVLAAEHLLGLAGGRPRRRARRARGRDRRRPARPPAPTRRARRDRRRAASATRSGRDVVFEPAPALQQLLRAPPGPSRSRGRQTCCFDLRESRPRGVAASKIAPQIGGALREVADTGGAVRRVRKWPYVRCARRECWMRRRARRVLAYLAAGGQQRGQRQRHAAHPTTSPMSAVDRCGR